MTWRTCPAATELETVVIDWLRQWLGLPDEFGGVVYDTASVGIMHALAVAREQAAPSTRKLGLTNRDLPRFRIYTSDQAHSAAEKSAIALGIGEENVRRVPSDNEFRMEISRLRETIAQDRQEGFQPLAVVATVGTTSSASVDPIPEIAKICREEKCGCIDGAYGGGFAMVPEYKWVGRGWEMADSIVVNPHKTLFVPLDFSVLYVRDLERLRRVFTLVPEVLRGDTIEGEKNYMDYGIQLGRRFRALKAWVIWRSLGRQGIGASARTNPPGKPACELDCMTKSFRVAAPVSAWASFVFVSWRRQTPDRQIEQRDRGANQRLRARFISRSQIARPNSHADWLGNAHTEEHLRKAGIDPANADTCRPHKPARSEKFQQPNPNDQSAIDLQVWSLRFAWVLELEPWDFPPHLRRGLAAATIFIRYDEGTAQAQGLADDRDRHSGDPVHFLFRATAGLRRDALRSICSHV